jgi:hypothetical protein
MTSFAKESNVRVKDADLESWPELRGRIGVVRSIAPNGLRVRVFFDSIGWLDFGPEQLEALPAPDSRP